MSTTALQCFLKLLISKVTFDLSNFIKHCRAVVDTCDLSNKDKDNDYHYDREGDISSPRNRRPRRPWSEDRTHLGGRPKKFNSVNSVIVGSKHKIRVLLLFNIC